MTTPNIIQKARTQLIVNHAFFASIALKRPITPDESIPTACVNAQGHIRYNPEFVAKLELQQVAFLIAHECMHWMQDNFTRMGSRNPKKWNRATDAVNNEILIASGVGKFIEGGVRWPGAETIGAEEIYAQMPDDPDDDSDGEGGYPGGPGDDMDHSAKPLSDAEKKQIQAEIRTEVAQAAQAAKQMGQMPSAMDRIIKDMLQPSVPWYDKLERFMDQRVKVEYSWAHPNKKHLAAGMYLPSLAGVGLGEVAFIRDTSASVSESEHASFNGHFSYILEMCQPTAVHIIDVSTEVAGVTTLEEGEYDQEVPVRGYGGTDMRAGFEYVEAHLPDVAVCVLLTDGGTPWPEYVGIDTIVVTTDRECPSHVGECIKIQVD